MPKVLLHADLLTLDQLLVTGGVKSLYASVAARGYSYAHWAGGVAYTMGLPATSSADYLRGAALLGIASPIFRILRPAQVDKLRFDLAKSYLRILQRILRVSPVACVDRDILVDELCDLYTEGLERNGLSVENWNLHFPLMILRRFAGDSALAAFWSFLRDTRRRPVHIGTIANLAVLAFIYRQAASTDIKCRQMAKAWLSRNPTIHTQDEVDKRFRATCQALRPAAPADLMDFIRLLDPKEPVALDLDIRSPAHSLMQHKLPMASATADATDRAAEGVPDRASAAVYEALIRRLTTQ